ncbi:MAG TPA: hypothetical protein VHV10_12415, partial [Ktedonobacteraceae bacterium]|nr:hypothetical protein [Ktedonobacteraceae bacterium]
MDRAGSFGDEQKKRRLEPHPGSKDTSSKKIKRGKFVSSGLNQYIERVSSPKIPETSYLHQGDYIQAQQMNEAD